MKRTDENEEWMEEEEEELGEEEEKGEKHQPISVRVTKILVFYLVIGFLGWNFFNFIFSSNFCNIEEVIIKGNDCLSEDEIFFKSGIQLSKNIFKLDLKKSISSLITKEGMVLSKIDRTEEGFTLPLLSGLEIDEIKIGEIIDKPEFRTALESINSAEVILPRRFCRVEILSPDDFMICNKDDTLKIRVNRPEVIINKENLLREALEKIERETLLVEYIDIRFKDSLVIKLKK